MSFIKKSEEKFEAKRLSRQKDENVPSYPVCLNCGTELKGMYCHKCGQYASEKTTKFKAFISEYLMTTYPIDSQIAPTLWQLIARPGYITNEFIAGKYNSYVHPLKLNLFFLFIVITVLVLFSTPERAETKMMDILHNEQVFLNMTISELVLDKDYVLKMKESDRDTVTIFCNVNIAKKHADIFTVLDARMSSESIPRDTLLVSLPSVLLDDRVFVERNEGFYGISYDIDFINTNEDLDLVAKVGSEMSELFLKYLPLIILLTCPLMAWAVRIFNRKGQKNYMHCFVFSLHYTAFLEIFLLVLYLISDMFHIEGSYILLWVVLAAALLYLATAHKRVFEDRNYIIALFKSLFINLFYAIVMFVMVLIVFLASVVVIMM